MQIRDPKEQSKSVAEVYLKDESMSTSGNYEKFFRAEGKIYSHIMDPRTGWPAQGVLTVSVVAPRTLDSEAWTKPFFVNGREWAAKHKPAGWRLFTEDSRKSCAWLNERPFWMPRRDPTDVRPVGSCVRRDAICGNTRRCGRVTAFLEIASGPTLAAATLQPVEIWMSMPPSFADLLLPVEPMGLKLR